MIKTTSHLSREKVKEKKLRSEEPEIDLTSFILESCLGKWTKIGERVSLIESIFGDYSYAMNDVEIIYAEVGKFCSIASHARINPPNHPLWRAALHHFSYRSRDYGLAKDDEEAFFNWRRQQKVILGHDVWIGHGAIVLPGVKVGTGAVVGAGAVVTKDVPPFTIVAGNPARVLRRRVNAEVEASLMRIAWWDWSHEALAKAISDFRCLDAAGFAAKFDPTFLPTLEKSCREEIQVNL